MRAGQLRHKIKIMTQSTTEDDLGNCVGTEVPFCTTRAAIWPMSAKEARKNMREEAIVSHNIRIRYIPGITHSMTISFNDRKFEIKGIINPDERNIMLDIMANEYL